MCKNKFSSRICNEIYCIMYHLNVTWSTLRGVVSFCAVFISNSKSSFAALKFQVNWIKIEVAKIHDFLRFEVAT